MKNLQITKLDVIIFFLGMLTTMLISLIYDWDGSIASFKEGYESVKTDHAK